jgi:hypothetical protein
MPCLICQGSPTIDAHLIPRAFASEVTSERGEKHVVAMADEAEGFRVTNTGVYDSEILCGPCDGLLGKHENYVFNCLKKIRAQLVPVRQMARVGHLNGDTFVKFAAGICWKYCVTRPDYGRMSIGPYAKLLAGTAFERTPIPSSIDVMAVQLQAGDEEAYFYRTPMPDRQDGINVVRFSVGGFVFFLKIDKRLKLMGFPPECWLKGKSSGAFPVAPAEMFEEWQMSTKLRSGPLLRSYLGRMLERGGKR